MRITEEDRGGVTVLRFEGRLDTNTAPEAQTELSRAIQGGGRKILIDFGALDYISSAGLRILLGAAKKLRGLDGSMRFCNLNETVAEVFEISGFDAIFQLHPSEDEAMEAF